MSVLSRAASAALLFVSVTASAATPAPAEAPAAVAAAAPVPVKTADAAKPKRICHREIETGSLMKSRMVCASVKGDRRAEEANRALVQQMQSGTGAGSGGN